MSRTIGDRTLYRGLDLDVSGGLWWVKGPSGAGKSELLRQIAGLVPGEGQLSLGDETPESLGWPTWRARVAYVPQASPRFDVSAETMLEKLASLAVRRERALDDPRVLTARWGLDERAWSASMQEISGGELQRIWLGIVLAGRPDVVLLDEPTSALDADAARAVEADLVGRTGLVVTHDVAFGQRVSTGSITLSPSESPA